MMFALRSNAVWVVRIQFTFGTTTTKQIFNLNQPPVLR